MFQVLANSMMIATRLEPSELRNPRASRRSIRNLFAARRSLDDLFASDAQEEATDKGLRTV